MKFYKLIKYDFINGIRHRWYSYAGGAVISFLFFCDFTIKIINDTGKAFHLPEGLSIINYLLYFFQGKEAFEPGQQDPFVFPAGWMLLFLYAAWLMLEYPLQNLTGHGMLVITRIAKRKLWWLSKCAWAAIGTIVYFSVLYLGLLLLCCVFGINITFSYAEDINNNILNLSFMQQPGTRDLFVLLVILPVLTSISLNLLQLCLGLFIKKIYSFAVIAVILLASAYYQSPFAVGNFAMVKRSELSISWGVSAWQGILINGAVIVITIMAGLWRVQTYDILIKE